MIVTADVPGCHTSIFRRGCKFRLEILIDNKGNFPGAGYFLILDIDLEDLARHHVF